MLAMTTRFPPVKHTLGAAALCYIVAGGCLHANAADSAESASAPSAASKSWQAGLRRTDLVTQDLATPNEQLIQVRVDFDPGVAAPKHSHPGVEVAYVIKGSLEYTLEGHPPVSLKAGESLYIPPGVPHIARNVGPDVGSELATYIVDKRKPLVHIEK
ncbi:cupin domain-containing protein [Caballeronia sp. GAFFF1]|uniref:cupin domain-containing protein n=1 Tax=Caballeronia sp. GAFFF1 TaxID=2921779 RepID=UPI002028AB2B|nr:cupin domain-containing protein [Caballeronia sp. GAFFF1]